MFQTKEQEKSLEKTSNETEINNLPDKGFQTLVIRILTEPGKKKKDEHSENCNKKLKNIKRTRGLPDGAVVDNLPANAGDMGSCPGLGRSHMLQSN